MAGIHQREQSYRALFAFFLLFASKERLKEVTALGILFILAAKQIPSAKTHFTSVIMNHFDWFWSVSSRCLELQLPLNDQQ